jgi:hypothetical protein
MGLLGASLTRRPSGSYLTLSGRNTGLCLGGTTPTATNTGSLGGCLLLQLILQFGWIPFAVLVGLVVHPFVLTHTN